MSNKQLTTMRCPFCAEEIPVDATMCTHCGRRPQDHTPPGQLPPLSPSHESGHSDTLRVTGLVLLAVSTLGNLYYFTAFDMSVAATSGDGRIINQGLATDRIAGMIFWSAVMVCGAIFTAKGFGSQSSGYKTPSTLMASPATTPASATTPKRKFSVVFWIILAVFGLSVLAVAVYAFAWISAVRELNQ